MTQLAGTCVVTCYMQRPGFKESRGFFKHLKKMKLFLFIYYPLKINFKIKKKFLICSQTQILCSEKMIFVQLCHSFLDNFLSYFYCVLTLYYFSFRVNTYISLYIFYCSKSSLNNGSSNNTPHFQHSCQVVGFLKVDVNGSRPWLFVNRSEMVRKSGR